jgi:hypothetical protein
LDGTLALQGLKWHNKQLQLVALSQKWLGRLNRVDLNLKWWWSWVPGENISIPSSTSFIRTEVYLVAPCQNVASSCCPEGCCYPTCGTVTPWAQEEEVHGPTCNTTCRTKHTAPVIHMSPSIYTHTPEHVRPPPLEHCIVTILATVNLLTFPLFLYAHVQTGRSWGVGMCPGGLGG